MISKEPKKESSPYSNATPKVAAAIGAIVAVAALMGEQRKYTTALEEACDQLSTALSTVPILNEEAIRAAIGNQAARLTVYIEPLTTFGSEDNIVSAVICEQTFGFSTHVVSESDRSPGFHIW